MLERHVLELKQSTHIVVFRPDSVEDDAYPLAFSVQLLTLKAQLLYSPEVCCD